MFVPLDIDYEMIGWRAKKRRHELHLTQEDVAEMTGISPSFVGHIERGEKKASIETIIKMTCALDTSTDYLLLGIRNTCEMEECEFYQDLQRLFRAYGIIEREM